MYYLKASIVKPPAYISAGNFISDADWIHAQRIIDSVEIIVGIRGTLFIEQDGTKYSVREGDVLLLLPGRLHRGYAPSPRGTSFYWIHFYCREDMIILDEKTGADEIALAKNNPYFEGLESVALLPDFIHLSSMDRVSILCRQLLHIAESHYYTRSGADYILASLLVELTEQAMGRSASASLLPSQPGSLARILEWIRIHSTQDISLQKVAHEFNYTREYLARYFKKHMGMRMQEYINKLKIAKARELLCQSDRNIREIAGLLGFQDDKYFLKLFKRYEKITPREYRRAYHRIHMNNE